MTLETLFSAIAALTGLAFVVASMLGTGLSLTVAQIVQPLKNARLVLLALLANFVLVPLLEIAPDATIPGRGSAAAWYPVVHRQAIERIIEKHH